MTATTTATWLAQFDHTVDKEWNSEHVSHYPAIHVGRDINIAIERRDELGRLELHLLGDAAEWVGPSVTVYAPEIDWAGRDDGYVIKPPTLNNSSAGLISIEEMQATARMFELAAEYAEIIWLDRLPGLQEQAKRKEAEYQAHAAEREEQARLERERMDNFMAKLDGSPLRVKVASRKTPVIGTLKRLPHSTTYLQLDVKWLKEPLKVKLEDLERVEQKSSNNRFTEVTI
jgi:hypothetical protein